MYQFKEEALVEGGPSVEDADGVRDKVLHLFARTEDAHYAEQAREARLSAIAREFLHTDDFSSEVDLRTLQAQFKESRIPDLPSDVGDYFEFLARDVVAHSIRTSSPRFIGHMTSALPYFMRPIGKLMTAMNQNVVKVETAKALTPYERQTLAAMHRLAFGFSDEFYAEHVQRPESTLGVLVSGGTVANITALWCARNSCFAARGDFSGAEGAGVAAALARDGARDAVVIGSSLMHYSFEKAAGLLGFGTHNLRRVPTDHRHRIDLVALRDALAECRARGQRVFAIVGIAGTTDSGAIDPLEELADIAHAHGIHFHVDAAWGGALLFSERYRSKLAGIERADSVTIDAHKQLYAPMGIGMVLLRDPQLAKVIEKQARYIVRAGSADLGRRALEGSRPGTVMFLHAALNIIGRKGYEFLVDEGIAKTQYMASSICLRPEFEVLAEPEMNILTYRYLPPAFRQKSAAGALTREDNLSINQVNAALQKAQRRAGRNFVSRTTLDVTIKGRSVPLTALRAVLANPLTTEADIDAVLDDQVRIAATQLTQ